MTMLRDLGALLVFAGLVGCGGRVPLPRLAQLPPRAPTTKQDLVPVGACDAWLDTARERAREIALAWIDERRAAHEKSCEGDAAASLTDWGGGCYGDDYCYGGGYDYDFSDDPLTAGGYGVSDATIRTRPTGGQPRAERVSGTNVQVDGVDEADIVKNDHKHVYVASGDALRIIQAWPPAEARVVSKVAIVGKPLRLFVTEDRAVVFSNQPGTMGSRTHVTILDIRDRAAPRTLRALTLSGVYLAARRVKNTVHAVVAQRRFPVLAKVGNRPMPPSLCRPDIFATYEDIRADIDELIDSQPDSAWSPSVELDVGGGQQTRVTCNQYRRDSPDFEVDGITSVVSFDIDGGQPSMVSLHDAAEVVYASERHLYIAVQVHEDGLKELRSHPSTERDSITAIHRFRLEPGRALYAGSSVVAGTLNNQFAMDEHGDRLRVASTGNEASIVSVLSDHDHAWGIRSWIGGIAPKETIRSVRFVGDRGYVVTFREVDPLFALDLSGGQVKLLGELKIPGYASYIHPLPEHRLLTVGFGSTDPERPNRLDSVRLQLVDATEPTKPTLEHVEILGKRGSESKAQDDHLAFNYFAPRKLLLLPIEVYRHHPDEADKRFAGTMAYTVDAAAGFQLLGQVPSPGKVSASRTIVMDDYVLMLTPEHLRIRQLSDLSKPGHTVRLD